MSLGACVELSRCFAAAKPNSVKSNRTFITSHSFRTPVDGYGAALSISRFNKNNRVVAGAGTYGDSSVDIDAGAEIVGRIQDKVPGIGGFSDEGDPDSYLVARTDGVGTKLMLGFETGMHDKIGIDPVAMSVNDLVTTGAKPLFFLDSYATGRLDVDVAEKVIKGIVEALKQCNCLLLGGETAEMRGLYKEGAHDLNGTAFGRVKKDSLSNGKNIIAGDILLGLPSNGVHSNGFSLVRRVLAQSGLSLKDQLPGGDITLEEVLMAPTMLNWCLT